MRRALAVGAALAVLPACAPDSGQLIVGSKAFTEGVVLGEIATAAVASEGVAVVHRRQLGGTRVLWEALRRGEIDAYVEYTGTLSEEILGGLPADDLPGLRQAVAPEGVSIGEPLGFTNRYALGVLEATATRLRLGAISDLQRVPELRYGLSNEFLDRADGWPGLSAAYGLDHEVRGLQHDLAYRALAAGEIDLVDVYTTDAEIPRYGIRVLLDDKGYFPDYRAVVLYRSDLERRNPRALAAITSLQGSIDVDRMAAMNAAVKLDGRSEASVAAEFLGQRPPRESAGMRTDLVLRTREHLALVAVSLSAALLVALPLGVVAARRPGLGRVVLSVAGVVQTIPSLALLVFMIPLLGIGAPPAIAALFLYSILPILRNTTTGLTGIPGSLLESADALGLPRRARLRLVELPLAAPTILAGIKTAAVINIGTATLGALIGAGGYGQPILTGIRLADTNLILQGAVPAALLALVAQALFGLFERLVVSRGLRL